MHTPGAAADVVAAARGLGLHLRLVDADHVGISTSEVTTGVSVHPSSWPAAAAVVDPALAGGPPPARGLAGLGPTSTTTQCSTPLVEIQMRDGMATPATMPPIAA
ncbi:MAG: hypothetical protein U0R78_15390 [Nocardioidaceae bacterium]